MSKAFESCSFEKNRSYVPESSLAVKFGCLGFSVPFSPSSKYRISTINVSWLGRNTDSKQAQIFPGNVRLRLTRETRPHDLNRFSSNLFPEHSVPLLRDCFSNDSAIYFRIKEYHKTRQRGVQLTYRRR